MNLSLCFLMSCLLMIAACTPEGRESTPESAGSEASVRLMTLNPGHFHAGLVHKYNYEQVDPTVYIYAPEGPELESHLVLIERFNTRPDQPTHWIPKVYRGDDYLEKMLADKPGNVMVVAGDNGQKIEYIQRAIQAGVHVLADKPMIIHPDHFEALKAALALADEQRLLVNDIMTERHEVTSILQKALSQVPELFGELVPGSPDQPAISKESVHHFSKIVAGQPLIRPVWFFDVNQQGEGIVDVSTHLVDLILWQVFPEEPIDYQDPEEGVEVITARSWNTPLSPTQFKKVTQADTYPDYLLPNVRDSILNVAANGEFIFKVRGVHGKVSVLWNFENPNGGDTHYSIMRGTRANLTVRQDEAQHYRATLYVEPVGNVNQEAFARTLTEALAGLNNQYQGLSAASTEFGWEIKIPDGYREGHEEHFTRVTELYLQYLEQGVLPTWERTNLLTKYYITTQAYQKSR